MKPIRLFSCFFAGLIAAVSPLSAQTAASALASLDGFAHAAGVRRVEYASAGKWLVSMDDNTIKTWSMPDGAPAGAVVLPERAEAFRCSPTEPLLALLTRQYDVELRTIPDLTLVRSWKSLDYTAGLAFSPDGKILATCAYGGIRFWNTSTGELVKHLEVKEVFSTLAFSPDGKWLVTAGRRELMGGGHLLSVWQLSDYTRAQKVVPPYEDGAIFTLAFTPDGKFFAAGSNNDQISLWHMPSGKQAVIKEGRPYGLWTVSAGTDGKTLYSADYGRIRLWNLPDCSARATFEAHSKQINSIAPSPDGLTIATGSDDRTIRLWKLADNSLVHNLVAPKAAPEPSPAGTPAGTAVATAPESAAPATESGPRLVVSGRLVGPDNKPVANIALKLPLAFPDKGGGLLYMFAPNFFEATTDADGRFRFAGVKPGEKYAVVHMSGTSLSPLKRTDGSIVLLDIGPGTANIDLGEIPFERR